MIILLNTSTPLCQLTLIDGVNRHEYEWQADRELAKHLHGWLRDRLADHGTTWSGLTGIGAFKGPGSFTGLRIGITVVNTLADSLHVPIVGVAGDEWKELALQRLENGENDRILLPDYGAEANITTQRK